MWPHIEEYLGKAFRGKVRLVTDPEKYGDPGRAILANEHIPRGSLIGKEAPLIVMPNRANVTQTFEQSLRCCLTAMRYGFADLIREMCLVDSIREEFEILREECGKVISELGGELGSPDFIDVFSLISIAIDNLCTTCGDYSFVNVFNCLRNHSIDANTITLVDNQTQFVYHVASRDIQEGEEFSFNYLGDGNWDASILDQHEIPLSPYEKAICASVLPEDGATASMTSVEKLRVIFGSAPECRLKRRILFDEETDEDWDAVDQSLVTIETCLLAIDVGKATGNYALFHHIYRVARSTTLVDTSSVTFWPTWMALDIPGCVTGMEEEYKSMQRAVEN